MMCLIILLIIRCIGSIDVFGQCPYLGSPESNTYNPLFNYKDSCVEYQLLGLSKLLIGNYHFGIYCLI